MFFIAASTAALFPDHMGLIVLRLADPRCRRRWEVEMTGRSVDLPDSETMNSLTVASWLMMYIDDVIPARLFSPHSTSARRWQKSEDKGIAEVPGGGVRGVYTSAGEAPRGWISSGAPIEDVIAAETGYRNAAWQAWRVSGEPRRNVPGLFYEPLILCHPRETQPVVYRSPTAPHTYWMVTIPGL